MINGHRTISISKSSQIILITVHQQKGFTVQGSVLLDMCYGYIQPVDQLKDLKDSVWINILIHISFMGANVSCEYHLM